MPSDCFWKVASVLGSDGGTPSHVRKGAASSVKNSLPGKHGHLVSRKQRWDIGVVKLKAEGLASEREASADGAVGTAELGFFCQCSANSHWVIFRSWLLLACTVSRR